MKRMILELRRDFILLSIAFIVFGALLLCFPDVAGTMIAYLCAALLIAFGALHLISYCAKKVPGAVYRFDLVKGLIGLALGGYICIRPELLISFFPSVLGVVILIDSFIKLENAIDLLRMQDKSWWIFILLAIVTAVTGILMLANPFTTAQMLLMFIGIALVASGVIDLVTVFRLSYRIGKVTTSMEESAQVLSSEESAAEDAPSPSAAAPEASEPSVLQEDAPPVPEENNP